MSLVFVSGCGAVSPAGWGCAAMRQALVSGEPLPSTGLDRPGLSTGLRVRPVPAPSARPGFLSHPRLRRASPITHYAAAAALEALGNDVELVRAGRMRLGVVLCVMTGCVNYSRRFFQEVLGDPATASPILFPETVFNAPASHIASLLGTTAINYTLVGDQGTLLQGLALAAGWISGGRVDAGLVIGAEEIDWLSADAMLRFSQECILGAGAGALYITGGPGSAESVRLRAISDAHTYSATLPPAQAARAMRRELGAGDPSQTLYSSLSGVRRLDAAEIEAWRDWPGARIDVKPRLGEGLAAAGAWQCVAAVDALVRNECRSAIVSIVGTNQQAIGAEFGRDE